MPEGFLADHDQFIASIGYSDQAGALPTNGGVAEAMPCPCAHVLNAFLPRIAVDFSQTCRIGGTPPPLSKPATQVIPRAVQGFSKQGGDLDRGIVAARFHELQVTHRNLGLLGQRLLGQMRGGTQPAHVLTEKISSCCGHRLDSEPSNPFDSEACFVFFSRCRALRKKTKGCCQPRMATTYRPQIVDSPHPDQQ